MSSVLQALRARLATAGEHPEQKPDRALGAVDLALLDELPLTPPDEKDAFLADFWRRLHAPFEKKQP
jgi:hypothetical protein